MSKLYSDTQLAFIAHAVAGGLDESAMMESADLSKARLRNLLDRKIPQHQLAVFDTHLARAKSRKALAKIKHVSEMTQMARRAYEVIDDTMGYEQAKANPELASRNAWKVLENADAPVFQQKTAGHTTQVNTQINLQTLAKAQEAFDVTTESVRRTTSEEMLEPLPPIGTPSRHIHISEAESVGASETVAEKAEDTGIEGEPEEGGE